MKELGKKQQKIGTEIRDKREQYARAALKTKTYQGTQLQGVGDKKCGEQFLQKSVSNQDFYEKE